MLSHLRDESALAVDTESNSLYVYQEQVCLIQISVPGTDYLIDPLALRNLSGLGPLLRATVRQCDSPTVVPLHRRTAQRSHGRTVPPSYCRTVLTTDR